MAIHGKKSGLDTDRQTKWTRRALIGSCVSASSVAAVSYVASRQFPLLFTQYIPEMKIPIAPSPRTPDPRQWPDRGLHAAWLGHSTVLLKIDGFTVLTDPVFSSRAGLDLRLFTAGVKRRVQPALTVQQLPLVDLILISHAHMDHLDTPSMRKLESKQTQVIMASQTSDIIRPGRYQKVTELAWGAEAQAGPVRVKAFEVNHWGARMRTDTYRGYNGYVLEVGRRRIVFGGDTAITDSFRSLKRLQSADLAIMPIGHYRPWIRFHCTPEQAWRMANDAGAEYVLPIHHRTFHLSAEPIAEPMERLVSAASSRPERVAVHNIGDEFHLT
jgi:L-ascorbate metabolism protein UlaG (beta-lactamase superfamily)